ncbi:MAG TPA: hypothetical protein VMS98_18975 [Thermoanaerobaculia bacterium]|nr:hypothetical protein [Thermoanaerobaculia bacterium]
MENLRAGEGINGFPNWSERVIHQWMNRARVDPQYEMSRCPSGFCGEGRCYTAKPPLAWSEALNRAARFHSDEMLHQGYFAHDSKCVINPAIDSLYPAGCNGAASCACVGGTIGCNGGQCTSWDQRVAMFGARPTGEIVAGGFDPNVSFYAWLFEPAPNPACGFNAQNGHRYLILESLGSVGVGVSGGPAVGDFSTGVAPGRIPSGSHYPKQAGSVEVWANWFDGSAPRSASVVVDGGCVPMKLARGSGQNGAWTANVSGAGSGCHRYYFSFIDSTGAEVTYPATGSLGIGGASCADWDPSRMASKCATTAAVPAKRRAARR